MTTDYLINQAVTEGKITAEDRFIYLAYAIREYSSLPTEFRGNSTWEPADEVTELTNTVMLAENMCQLTPCVQAELRRVMGKGVSCDTSLVLNHMTSCQFIPPGGQGNPVTSDRTTTNGLINRAFPMAKLVQRNGSFI